MLVEGEEACAFEFLCKDLGGDVLDRALLATVDVFKEKGGAKGDLYAPLSSAEFVWDPG